MKKILAITISAILLIAAVAFTSFALNNDDVAWTEIGSADELLTFSGSVEGGKTYYVKLTDNIDMCGKAWTPIKDIALVLEGQGYTISGLTVENNAGVDNYGMCYGIFIDYMTQSSSDVSKFSNVAFKDCSLTVADYTSDSGNAVGLIGKAQRFSAENVTLDNIDITVDKATTDNNVHIAAGLFVGQVERPYDDGFASFKDVTIKDTCSLSVDTTEGVSEGPFVAGVVGYTYQTRTLFLNVDVLTTDVTVNNLPSTRESYTAKAYISKDYNKVGVYIDSDSSTAGLPVKLSEDDDSVVGPIFNVTTADEYLTAVAQINSGNEQDAVIYVKNDIDFTGKTFQPITIDFFGAIYGNGYSFKNITYTATTPNENMGGYNVAKGVGLLAYKLDNGWGSNSRDEKFGTIRSLTIADSTVTLTIAEGKVANIGVFAGFANRGVLVDCHLANTKLTVDASLANNSGDEIYIGGIVGKGKYGGKINPEDDYNSKGSVYDNCTTDSKTVISVTGDNSKVIAAGLIGNYSGGNNLTLKNCTNRAAVSSYEKSAGLIGKWEDNAVTIENSQSYGSLTAKAVYGVAASNANVSDGAMTLTGVTVDCYAFVDASATVVDYAEKATADSSCSANITVITNPIVNSLPDTATFTAYYQTKTESDNSTSYRIVFVADQAHLATIEGSAEDVIVTVTFTYEQDGVTKTGKFTETLAGCGLYSSVEAGDDLYEASEGDCLFGMIITNVPVDTVVIMDVDAAITKGEATLYDTAK